MASSHGNVKEVFSPKEKKDLSLRRQGEALSLRRDHRSDAVIKRRRPTDPTAEPLPETKYTADAITSMVAALHATDAPITIRREALSHLRTIVSGDDAPVHLVVSTGGVPVLIHELGNPATEYQYDALCCLTNIAASSVHAHTASVMPAAPRVTELLTSANDAIAEQAAWCLGNLATDDTMRATLVANGVMQALARLLVAPVASKASAVPSAVTSSSSGSSSSLRTVAWALGLCVHAPTAPLIELFRIPHAVTAMLSYIASTTDDALTIEVAWLLAHVVSRDQGSIAPLMDVNIINVLITRMTVASQPLVAVSSTSPRWSSGTSAAPPDPAVVALAEVCCVPLVKLLGNLLSGPDRITDTVLANRASLPSLLITLQSAHRGLRRETAFAVSNIAAGASPAYADALVSAGFIIPLCNQFIKTNYDIQRECIRALLAIGRHTSSHLVAIVEQPHVVSTLLDMLQPDQDTDLCTTLLQMVELILSQLPARRGPAIIQESDGIDALERIQRHEHVALWSHASRLVDTYFGAEDDEEEQARHLAPHVKDDRFAFGTGNSSGTFDQYDFAAPSSSSPAAATAASDSKSSLSSYGTPSFVSGTAGTFVSPRMAALGLTPSSLSTLPVAPPSSSAASSSPLSLRMQQLAARDAAEAANRR